MLDPEEIFADLISFRKEINAPEVHMDYTLKPFRFVIYNPESKNARFHFMPCTTIMRAQTQGRIANLRRTSNSSGIFPMYGALPQKLSVCNNCVNEWNNRFPDKPLDAKTFDIAKFFLLGEYYPDVWDVINIPPEIKDNEFMPNFFLLYRPIRITPNVFHFMKCKTVCDDEKIGWIKTYSFTCRTSGVFDMYDGSAQRLSPCEECLSEWNDGTGWKGYSSASDEEKKIIRKNFSVEEFFEHCNNQEHMPNEIVEFNELMKNNAAWCFPVDNNSPENWSAITDMYRTAKGYRCEECGVDMSKHPNLAITHHINGCHPDVRHENMKVLCIWCHSKQPHHAKTVYFNRYQYNLLRKLRSEQGIKMSDFS